MQDNWSVGSAYELYMGRWSRPLARSFVSWLRPQAGLRWLDVGCGTGALTRAICDLAAPASVLACDPSEAFVHHATAAVPDNRVSFVVADAEHLPEGSEPVDHVVSALVLNFLPDPLGAIGAMRRMSRPNAVIAACVWDYQEGMEFLRLFWDEAVALDPAAEGLHEGRRFPLCRPGALTELFTRAGLRDVVGSELVVPTSFRDFDDFWKPLLNGTGPAPAYVASLTGPRREELRKRLSSGLGSRPDGTITLNARAWVASGRVGAG